MLDSQVRLLARKFIISSIKISYSLTPSNVVKAEVISEIAKRTGISRADVRLTVETLTQTIKDALTKGGKVHLRGFGSFVAQKRARKVARNISQNTALIIEEHYIPSFKPAKAFSKKVKENSKVSI